jgi:type II secretory pathway component GspD/PulD (secretin)
MGLESDQAIDELIANLDKIPKVIESEILIKEISKKIAQELGTKISL